MDLNETQQAAKAEYEQQKARRAELTQMTLQVAEGQTPTPTQEENDLLRLGLMHPDEKAAPAAPEMPSLQAQQAYMAAGEPRLAPVQQQRTPPPAARPAPEQRAVPRPPAA